MNKIFFSLAILSLLVIQSCKPERKKASLMYSREVIADTTAGSCPYITKDNKNNIVLSWIKQKDSLHHIFCFSISTDGGKTFGKPIEVPGSGNVFPHGENMPKILFKPSGEVIAIWGAHNPNPKNAYSGLVYFSRSLNAGATWSSATPLVSDTSSYDQRYFDIALLPGGEAAVVWLDNRKTLDKEGSGLYYATTSGSTGFENEKLISEPCCQCCRTNLFVDSKKNIHVLYRAILNDSIRDMVHIVSNDNGNSFSAREKISADNWVINGCPHTGPAMTENNEGLHFTWFTAGSGVGVFYNNSADNGKTFSPRDSVSGASAKHSQITSLPDGRILLVWNESFPNGKSFSSRIGMEIRNEKGGEPVKDYITSAGSMATFPVIKPIDDNTAIVAYTESSSGKDQVAYRVVSTN